MKNTIVNYTNFEFVSNDNRIVSTVKQVMINSDNGKINPMLNWIEYTNKVVVINGITKSVPYSSDIVELTYSDDIVKNAILEGFYVNSNMEFVDNSGYNLVTEVKEDVTGYTHYTYGFSSAGAMKKNTIMFVSDNVDYSALLNKVTHGAYNKYQDREVTLTELGKLATRFVMRTSMEVISNAKVGAIALYVGEFAKNGGLDGISFMSSSAFPYGVSLHGRTGMCKDQVVNVNKNDFNNLLAYRGDLVTGLDDSIIDDIIMKNNHNYDGKTIVIGSGEINYLIDLNSVKGIWDYSEQLYFQYQEVYTGENAKSKMNFSTQLAMKLFAVNPVGTTNYIIRGIKDYVDNTLIVKEGDINQEEGELKFSSAMETALALDNKAKERYGFLYAQWLKNARKQMLTNVKKMRFTIDGYERVAVGDIASYFGANILEENEQIIHDVTFDKGIMIKYPTAPVREYQPVVQLRMKDYSKRVKASIANQEQAKTIISIVSSLSKELVMVSSKEDLRKRLAGFDFDTDHIFTVTDKFVVDTLFNTTPLTVDIDYKPVPNKHCVKIDKLFLNRNFHKYTSMENISVGAVTKIFNMFSILKLDIDSDHGIVNARKFIKSNFKGAHSEDYVPVFESSTDYVVISMEQCNNVWKQLGAMKLTKDNIKLMLVDINVAMCRFYQELSIDAVKKVYTINIDNASYILKTVKDISIGIKLEKGKVVPVDTGVGIFNNISNEIVGYINNKIDPIIEEINKNPELLSGEAYDFSSLCWDKLSKDKKIAYKNLVSSLYQFRSIYRKTEDKEVAVEELKSNMLVWQNQFRVLFNQYSMEGRMGIVFGAEISNASKNVLSSIGSILKEELFMFINKFGDNKDFVINKEDLEVVSTNRIVRIVSSDAKKKEKMIAILKGFYRKNDAVITFKPYKDAVRLFINDKPMGLYVSIGANKENSTTIVESIVNKEFNFKYGDVDVNNNFASLLLVVNEKA